jgi:DNA-binding transcriptional ArsR family regulator
MQTSTPEPSPSRPLQYGKAIREADLPSGTKATCWAIATYADNKTGKAWPSLRELASATGLSQDTVSKHTIRAEAAGYLHKQRRLNNSIVYTITEPQADLRPTPGAVSPPVAAPEPPRVWPDWAYDGEVPF